MQKIDKTLIFNLGNLLLVAAISVAGMAVAFPLGAGLALVISAVLNYFGFPPRTISMGARRRRQ
jgi:glucose uptake protein GlcU